jgi:hypothetical protein
MALGLTYGSGSGGDIIPFVKYDSRAGRFSRNDRKEVNGVYSNETVDITQNFKAVIDMENIEVGYLKFAAATAPEFLLVPLGDPMPQKPADASWKQGARLMMKLHASCGGDIRECASNAAAFLKGVDELHSAYEAGKAANPGKLPIVVLRTTMPVTSGQGAKKSTNYQPVFEISGWSPRPVDLVHVGKGGTVSQAASPATAPSTGSTRVDPPRATTPPANNLVAADDDFG